MATVAGQGDPEASVRLLWRAVVPAPPRPQGPGRRPGLTVDAIVAAGIAVADAVGVAATSMRAVADRLGVTAMALYRYVPGKEELVDLMYDGVHAEMPPDHDAGDGWRPALNRWADDLVALYLRHPWVSQVSLARAVLGPNEQTVIETLVAIVRGTGLEAGVLRRIVTTIFHLARGTAQTVTESRRATASSGMSEGEWWSRRTAALLAVVPDFRRRFPMSAWLTSNPADDCRDGDAVTPYHDVTPYDDGGTPYVEREAVRAFRDGLSVLLDGIEAATGSPAAGGGGSSGIRR